MTELVKDEILSVEILESMPQSELENLARKKAEEIFSNIIKINKKIEEAKKLSIEARELNAGGSDIKNIISLGIAGESRVDKISNRLGITIEGQISQNEAIFELSKIVQESIKFTQLTSKFSSSLQQAMFFSF